MVRLIKAAGALLVLAVLLLGFPVLLVATVGNPWPAGGVDELGLMTNSAVLGLVAVLGWFFWAQVVACTLWEIPAALRGIEARRVPIVLGGQQHAIRWLVHTILAVGVTSSVFAPTVPSRAEAAPAAPSHSVTQEAHHSGQVAGTQPKENSNTGADVAAKGTQHHRTAKDAWPRVTTVKGDTLWGLAETHLGDGFRWREIADLNQGQKMSGERTFTNPHNIEPGWQLKLPADAANLPGAATQHEVVVEPGDTLSGIAEEELGNADRWHNLYEDNRDLIGPNPDLIHPGQVIQLPAARTGSPENTTPGDTTGPTTGLNPGDQPGADQPPAARTPAEPLQAPQTPAAPAVSESLAPAAGASSGLDVAPATSTAVEDEDQGGFSALRALLASAVCLSFGALTLVAVNRRRQFRQRRPGRTIAATPESLTAVERAVVENGGAAQADVEFLDRALRHLAASCRAGRAPLPQLGAAVLGEEDLTLLFTHPAVAEVPTGWTATDDARAWMLPRWTFLEEELLTQPAPYPALVTIGLDEGDRTWLLDLETLGVFSIAGARDQVSDLTRFLVAELAVNAWSEGAEILLAGGFGAETIGLNPARLRQVGREAAILRAAALTRDATESEQNLDTDLLGLRRDAQLLDGTGPVVIVVPGRAEEVFADIIKYRDRSRVVVVHEDDADPAIELSGDGMAYLPRWGTSVKAFTLPATDADTMAALVASTRNLADASVPAADDDASALGKYVNADGSLREEFTEARHSDGHDFSSLLPEPDEVYLATAATTAEDLAALAPSVPEATQAEIDALDPTLDQDVADWLDPTSIRPKVHLLGPVDVTALAGTREGIANLGGTIEFIVYLACQERGVTGERAAEAFDWKTVKTVQNRALDARKLLGTRPDGTDWLPDAGKTESAKRGVPSYELDTRPGGVLINHDLFVRLKIRAQQRGDGGLDDLVTALSLVTGEPFDQLRRGGYGWLLQGQRLDHIMVGAIHDVAHVVATRAVAEGRTDLVRQACDAARKASPDSDVAWLDLAAAAEAESGRAAADELVRKRVVDRVDEDLPPRTEAVIDRRGWLAG
jgi:LysM repeat protein